MTMMEMEAMQLPFHEVWISAEEMSHELQFLTLTRN